jgi:hypothetical protein
MSEASPPGSKLAGALAKAQGEIKDPPRNKNGQVAGKRDYRYAGIDDLLGAVRPTLSKHGLAIIQMIETSDAGRAILCTTLFHESGEAVSSRYPLQWSGTPQQHGS